MANELTIFTEIFPVQLEALPNLTLYQLKVSGAIALDEIGGKVCYRLQTKFGGHWKWDKEKEYVITDSPQDEPAIKQILQEIWETSDEENVLRSLENIEVFRNDTASTQGVANFVARSLQDDFSQTIDKALAKHRREAKTHYVNLKSRLRGWVIDNHPAVSVSITSELESKIDLKTYLAADTHTDRLKGLNVTDKTKPFQTSMPITGIVGRLGENDTRDRLLAFKPPIEMKHLIEQAPNDELVVKVAGKYDYVVSALKIKIHNADYARFKINEKLQIEAAQRVKYITSVASIIQESSLVDSAYAENKYKHLFLNTDDIGYNPKLRIGSDKITTPNAVLHSLKEFGLYKSAPNKQIRIAILNASPQTSLDQLRKHLRNELDKQLGYELIQATKQESSSTSREFIESAIEKIAEKDPDIILGIIPTPSFDTDDWTPYDDFKQLTLERDLQSQVIQPHNVDNYHIIGNVVLGILAKTGNLPYVLADPITYADLVVGLDVARQKKRNLPGTINSAGMARIYFANGELMRYNIRETMLEGETIPPRILRNIFPQKEFTEKKILIHRDGILPESEREALTEWGNQIGATFYFVEVIKSGTPRLYASQNGKIVKAPKGSILKLSETEALLVSSEFPAGFRATPQPIRVRTYPPFSLKHALHSVLSLTLLHYGSLRQPRLPVTTHYADKISSMAVKGLKPKTLDGAIPFWL
ncbi:MAG: Piwi domain-containing protein [Candidatus Poribacteria bacterium]|nr:Piwi domain-containing protein [Candidatus Poribacteria bacterium]